MSGPLHPGPDGSDPARPVPGAAQLELVRRLAERYAATRPGRPGPPGDAFTALADRALGRSGPGRGLPELPLLVPGHDGPTGVGAPPVDPGDLPLDEVVRVGIGLLADLVVEAGPVPAPATPRRRLLARPAFHLAGAPVTTADVRAALAAAGHVEGGRSPEVVLVAAPLDDHLAEVWSTRVQNGAPVRWETFAGRWARRDALPPSADLPRIAAFWAAKVGPDRVHVVVADTPAARRWTATSHCAGSRHDDPTPVAGTDPARLAPEATDVLRRLNRVLNVRVPDDARPGLLRRARRLLPEVADHPLALPPAWRDWAARRAERVAGDLRSGGYAVHGDLDRIVPRHAGAALPRRPDVLTLVLDTCLRTAEIATTGAGGQSR